MKIIAFLLSVVQILVCFSSFGSVQISNNEKQEMCIYLLNSNELDSDFQFKSYEDAVKWFKDNLTEYDIEMNEDYTSFNFKYYGINSTIYVRKKKMFPTNLTYHNYIYYKNNMFCITYEDFYILTKQDYRDLEEYEDDNGSFYLRDNFLFNKYTITYIPEKVEIIEKDVFVSAYKFKRYCDLNEKHLWFNDILVSIVPLEEECGLNYCLVVGKNGVEGMLIFERVDLDTITYSLKKSFNEVYKGKVVILNNAIFLTTLDNEDVDLIIDYIKIP